MGKFSKLIEAYCQAEGISIPAGFYRGSANRYAVIKTDSAPFKLVARTWFNQRDVEHYLANITEASSFQVLDFKERRTFNFGKNGKLSANGSF